MRYSLFAGGKRIRPILCMAAAETIREDPVGIEDVACALELVHTYSLIHDDLPALDNDDLRRGLPTSHKVFGEAMAILAGDSLLTLAFQVLAQLDHSNPASKNLLVLELATAAGTVGGMIAGQVHDLEGEGKNPEPVLLEQIHRAKTGAMLRASLRMGAIYAGASEAQLAALTRYGEHIGLAFQIVDDLLDVEQTSEALGKTAGKDAAQHKITFPAVYGLQQSHQMAETEGRCAHLALEMFAGRAERLREIADLIVYRKA
jgi:geranylgeranyl diphosphate synthase type II